MLMRKLTVLILALIILLPAAAVFAGSEERRIRVFFDGEEIISRVAPQFINNRLVVPVRPFLETLEAKIVWDIERNAVSATWDGQVIVLFVNRPIVEVNGNIVNVDVPAVVVEGTTMLPLRVVSELFGLRVNWDEVKGIAEVVSKNHVPFRLIQGAEIAALPLAVRNWMEINLPQQGSRVMDYDNSLYILSSLGWKPSGGYVVKIRRIVREGTAWRVNVELREPLSGQPTIQVVSNPYDLVRVDLEAAGRPSNIIFRTITVNR